MPTVNPMAETKNPCEAENADRIPFNRPICWPESLANVAEAAGSGRTAGNGPWSKKCCRLMEERFGTRRALLTPSCTHALELAALLLELRPGDEVIVPSFAFVSTVNAMVLRGAVPVFVDVQPDTLNIDPAEVRRALSPKTRAVVLVHYAGMAADLSRLVEMTQEAGVSLIEDAAHAIGGRYYGKSLGTFGRLGAFSFHESKNIHCGEGGALWVNDDELIHRAEVMQEKGTDRAAFFRGEVDKYTWRDLGSSFLLSDLQAAFLYPQLERLEEIRQRRRRSFEFYFEALQPLAEKGVLRLPVVPEGCESAYHTFYILLTQPERRDELLRWLRAEHIHAVFHYLPLHLSPFVQKIPHRCVGDLPVTQTASAGLVRLPLYYDLTRDEQTRVVEHIEAFFKNL